MDLQRIMIAGWVGVLVFAAGGCGIIKLPRLPKPLAPIHATIERATLVDMTDEAAAVDVYLRLVNTNDEPMPMVIARYTVECGQARFTGDQVPNATMPDDALEQVVRFPAVLLDVGDPVGKKVRARGTIEIQPPGEIRQLMSEWRLPRPTVSFDGTATIEPADASLPAPPPEPSPTDVPTTD
jgi:hypothetical protein